MKDVNEVLKNVLLATVGGVALSLDKSKELVEELVETGELTVSQGKELNEELKHKAKAKAREVLEVDKVDAETIMSNLDNLTKEQLQQVKDKIAEMETGDQL